MLAITSTAILSSSIPKTTLLLAASTALHQTVKDSSSEHSNEIENRNMFPLSPRTKSCLLMAASMSFHFGGYEFARSGALALFTSSETGFSHPSAYPFAIGLVTPASLGLLFCYGLILKAHGPRQALKRTKALSILILAVCTISLKILETSAIVPSWVSKALVALLFIFQNSYAHLLYTQQWSFLGSVMTPSEGTKWFSTIAGLCSLVCTVTATLVNRLVSVVGLLGLMLGTCFTLALSLFLADQAYRLGEENGFDPTPKLAKKQSDKREQGVDKKTEESLISKTTNLFQRVPTLAALFAETVSFQSLSTVLAICFVRQLKESMPLDTDRAAFTGGFYAYINGFSCLMQFFILPLARKYLEPQWVYRLLPALLLPMLVYLAFQSSSLWIVAAAFFSLKTLDYSLRNIVNEMVYQPLDFDSRYVGKEVIGVFANRFGKSGMSMILSLVTVQFPGVGIPQLSQLSIAVASIWTTCSVWLSRNVLSNKEAERRVKERQTGKTE